MSDFVTELRREVVGAHAQHRVAAVRTRRRRRRPILAGAVALAALLVAVVMVVRSIPQPERTAEPRVVKVLRIGGEPSDGATGDGSLWVTDFQNRQVVRIDPERRRVIARIPLDESPSHIAADDDSVWALGDRAHPRTRMWRIDPGSNRVAARSDGGNRWLPAMADGAVWVFHELVQTPTIDRLSPAGEPTTTRIPFYRGAGMASAGRWLWVLGTDGTVVRIDAGSGDVAHRWPQLAPLGANPVGDGGDGGNAIVADEDGAWVVSPGQGRVLRLEGDRVVRALRIGPSLPMLAASGGSLWVATSDDPRAAAIERIDARSGRVTATVQLGTHYPRALVPVRGGLWVIAGDGTVVLVDT
jgi:hypothetical protein